MRNRTALVLLVAAAAIGGSVVAVGRADAPAARPADRTRFEYKVVSGGSINASGTIGGDYTEQLNKLGADGWELVTVATAPPPFSATTMYLKRAVPAAQPAPAPAKP